MGTLVETGVDNVVIRDITMGQAQQYWAVAQNNENGSNVFLDWVSTDSPWVHQVPYADGGGRVLDSQPVFYVIEFYVTAFDRLIWDSPEQSLVSELFTSKIIKFGMSLTDSDTDPSTIESVHHLFGPDSSWVHGILLAQTVVPTEPLSKAPPGAASRPACRNSNPICRAIPGRGPPHFAA